jgi:16S rRNA (guanine527-N7)-methyltransferase
MMEIPQIADLLSPYVSLSSEQLGLTSMYIDILLKWNDRINLTAIRRPEDIVTRHFGESFFVAQKLVSESWRGSVIDFGSGPGFPGIPVALYRPNVSMTLIESNGKKATFLAEVISQLGLRNVEVFRGRGESYAGKAELVLMRAVERFADAFSVAAGLVAPGGRVGLLLGEGQVEDAKAGHPEFRWDEVVPIPLGNSRVLLVGNL